MESRKNPVGAPPKYRSVKAMQEKIDAYFEACKGKPFLDDNGEPMRNKNGYIIYDDKKPLTVTGLALALGFASRQALLNYQTNQSSMTLLRVQRHVANNTPKKDCTTKTAPAAHSSACEQISDGRISRNNSRIARCKS